MANHFLRSRVVWMCLWCGPRVCNKWIILIVIIRLSRMQFTYVVFVQLISNSQNSKPNVEILHWNKYGLIVLIVAGAHSWTSTKLEKWLFEADRVDQWFITEHNLFCSNLGCLWRKKYTFRCSSPKHEKLGIWDIISHLTSFDTNF